MDAGDVVLLGVGTAILAYLIYESAPIENDVQSGAEDLQAAVTGWASVNEGPTWVPVINQTESANGIPPDLLARIAYQESHFRPDVIDGSTPGGAGELGIMQLEPQYFSSVTVPVPFSASDTQAQITQAGAQLASLYQQFNDWGTAVAAYNDGAANIQAYLAGTRALPSSTADYVTEVLTDVPVATNFKV